MDTERSSGRRRPVFPGSLVMVLGLLAGAVAVADAPASHGIVGTWLATSETGDPAHVEIYVKVADGVETFHGRFIFFPGEDENGVNIGESALDTLNPDESLRSRRLIGLDMLEGMTYDAGKNRWVGGTVYDPDVGKTYKCRIVLKDAHQLELRGYVGVPLFGRSEVWTRL